MALKISPGVQARRVDVALTAIPNVAFDLRRLEQIVFDMASDGH